MRRLFPTILILFALTACEEFPQEPRNANLADARIPGPGTVSRSWRIEGLANDADFNRLLESDTSSAVEIHRFQNLGPMSLNPQGLFPNALGQVLSSRNGQTYWVSVEAPTSAAGLTAPDSLIGGEVVLRQMWRYRKVAPHGSLRMVIVHTTLEGQDGNGRGVDFDDCPWWVGGPVAQFPVECAGLIRGEVEASFYAYADPVSRTEPVDVFYYASGMTLLFGFADRWSVDAYGEAGSMSPLFTTANFDTNLNMDGVGRHARTRLTTPIVVEIPLDSIERGEEFEVVAFVRVRAFSRRQGESYISAYFRDPVAGDGVETDTHGLILLDPPAEIPQLVWTPPEAECSGPAGIIEFDTSDYLHPEWPGDRAWITVTRSGGTGPASVVFTTGAGTATPDVDFTPVTTVVRFEEGEEGSRAVAIPVHADTQVEENETVSVSLSGVACASLGLSHAELTIFDDDGDHEPELFTLGGTVTGLVGTGLRLRNRAHVIDITGDGPFQFPAGYPSGDAYDVTVEVQPTDPLQVCTVTSGAGTFGSANVNNVIVTCTTPSGSGLDEGFGTNGIVNVAINPYVDERFAATVALQSDGKVVVAGDDDVARYNADGTLDTSFGSGGIVPIQFRTSSDALLDVAVQPDGRILVAGIARDLVNLPANDDYGVARLMPDGTLDPSFGSAGITTVDMSGRIDGADDILIQPDGSIIVIGTTHTVDPFGATDPNWGVVRLMTDGTIDPTFGTNGRAVVDIAGRGDVGHAAAFLSDGSIVITGRAAESGGADSDIAIARINANGVLVPTFGDGGIMWEDESGWSIEIAVDAQDRIYVSGGSGLGSFVQRYDANGTRDVGFGSNGTFNDPTFLNANGLAVDAAGRLIVVGIVGGNDFGVRRLDANGVIDKSFGDNGLVRADFFADFDHASDVVIQSDGRIVVVGKAENGLVRTVGMIRVIP